MMTTGMLLFIKVIATVLLVVSVIYAAIRIRYRDTVFISVKTIKICLPPFSNEQDEETKKLIAAENYLRKLAYKTTSIKTDDSFFDNSDMCSDYYLVVIYDKRSHTPLLSARYYFDKTRIAKALNGDAGGEPVSNDRILNRFNDGEVFLSDRLSGNVSNALYRRYRDYIFLLFYSEVLTKNKNRHLILMARRDKHEKLLTKYIRQGFNIIGLSTHKGKEHWIVLADLKARYSQIKRSVLADLLLIIKYSFSKKEG